MNPVTAAQAIVRRNSNALLLVVCLGQFMVILDVSIVNVALPSIKDALGFSTTGLQWVLNAYTLTFAGFLLLGGRAADLFGRRRMFYAGTLIFSGASLICAIAPSAGALVAARALQGIGAAILSPATLAIITTSFDEGAPRNRALGAWGAVGAIGATSGVLLGGVLTEVFSWPAIFVINVPIGLAVVLFSSRLVPEGRSEVENRHFDLPGAVLVTLGMTALTYGIVTTDRLGWASLGVLGPVVAGAALLVAFGLYEARLARHPQRVPLMPLSVFRLRNLRAANLVIFLLYAAIFGFWFFQSLYMQGTLGYTALETGLAFVPMTLAVGTGAVLAPRLARRFGARAVLAAGMLFATAGEALLIGVHPGGTYWRTYCRAECSALSASGWRWYRRRSWRSRVSPAPSAGSPRAFSTPPASSGPPWASPCSAQSPRTTRTPRWPPAPPPPRRSPTASTSNSESARPSV